MSIYTDTGRFDEHSYSDLCSSCGKAYCRCREWGDLETLPAPKDWTVRYYSPGLKQLICMWPMTQEQAEAWIRTLTTKQKRGSWLAFHAVRMVKVVSFIEGAKA
jgi:hypothetical protein